MFGILIFYENPLGLVLKGPCQNFHGFFFPSIFKKTNNGFKKFGKNIPASFQSANSHLF